MQRKASKKTRAANADEKRFMAWVKSQPCIQCGSVGVVVDHCYGSTFRHNKVLIGMWALLPLCPVCDDVKTMGSHRAYHREFGETQAESYFRLLGSCPADIAPPQDVINAIKDWNR